MKKTRIFEQGKGNWVRLMEFLNNNNISIAQMLAVVCANLYEAQEDYFTTSLMIDNKIWRIAISKDDLTY